MCACCIIDTKTWKRGTLRMCSLVGIISDIKEDVYHFLNLIVFHVYVENDIAMPMIMMEP